MDISKLLLSAMIVLVLITEIHSRRPRNKTMTTTSGPSMKETFKTSVINEIPGLVSLTFNTIKGLVVHQLIPEADDQDSSDKPAPGPIPARPVLTVSTKATKQSMPDSEQAMPGFPFSPMPGQPQFPFTAQYHQEYHHSGSAVTKCNQLMIISIITALFVFF